MKIALLCILSINSGLSSIQFALFEASDSLLRILEGTIDLIGLSEANLRVRGLNKADNWKMVQNLLWTTGCNVIAIPAGRRSALRAGRADQPCSG